MAVRITFYGRSCFGIEGGGGRLIIDPYLTGNPLAPIQAREVLVDYIVVTHAHGDHFGDTIAIAKRTGATVIANFEIATYVDEHGAKSHALHIGGGADFPFGRVKLTIAHHGSSFDGGRYGGSPAGALITLEGKTLYHAGDTGLFYDMKLIGELGVDVAMLPIGGTYTMDPDDALRAVKLIEPKVVIPMHFEAEGALKQDPAAFRKMVEAETKTRCVVLKPGETFTA